MKAIVTRHYRGDYHVEIAGRFRLFVGRGGRLNGFFDTDKTKARKTYAKAQALASACTVAVANELGAQTPLDLGKHSPAKHDYLAIIASRIENPDASVHFNKLVEAINELL